MNQNHFVKTHIHEQKVFSIGCVT